MSNSIIMGIGIAIIVIGFLGIVYTTYEYQKASEKLGTHVFDSPIGKKTWERWGIEFAIAFGGCGVLALGKRL